MQARTMRRMRHRLRCLTATWLDRLIWCLLLAAGLAVMLFLAVVTWTVIGVHK